jgi:hypothetical protein
MELSVKEMTKKVKKSDEGEEVSFVTKLTDGPEEFRRHGRRHQEGQAQEA